MVQFTNNDGMCNDAVYVNVNLAQTTHPPGTTPSTLYEQCVGSLTSHRIYDRAT